MNRRTPVPSSDPTAAPTASASFETSIKRLTEIVTTLERGDLPLEESLRLFEEGVKLSARVATASSTPPRSAWSNSSPSTSRDALGLRLSPPTPSRTTKSPKTALRSDSRPV